VEPKIKVCELARNLQQMGWPIISKNAQWIESSSSPFNQLIAQFHSGSFLSVLAMRLAGRRAWVLILLGIFFTA
jgi:hypothetical protein